MKECTAKPGRVAFKQCRRHHCCFYSGENSTTSEGGCVSNELTTIEICRNANCKNCTTKIHGCVPNEVTTDKGREAICVYSTTDTTRIVVRKDGVGGNYRGTDAVNGPRVAGSCVVAERTARESQSRIIGLDSKRRIAA